MNKFLNNENEKPKIGEFWKWNEIQTHQTDWMKLVVKICWNSKWLLIIEASFEIILINSLISTNYFDFHTILFGCNSLFFGFDQ